MKTRNLGTLQVSAIGMGCMGAVDMGIRFLTAEQLAEIDKLVQSEGLVV